MTGVPGPTTFDSPVALQLFNRMQPLEAEHRKFKRPFRPLCAVAKGGASVGLTRLGHQRRALRRLDGCSAAPLASVSRRLPTVGGAQLCGVMAASGQVEVSPSVACPSGSPANDRFLILATSLNDSCGSEAVVASNVNEPAARPNRHQNSKSNAAHK